MNCNPLNSLKTVRALLIILVATLAAPADAGEWTVTGSAGKSITNWHGQAATQVFTVSYRGWNWKGFDLAAGVAPYIIRQPKSWFSDDYGDGNETIVGPALRMTASKSWRRASVLQPYAELTGGPLWTPKQVPDSTSQMNWVTDIGSGVTIASPQSRTALIVGYRFSHISNSGLSSRNPGWNVSSVIFGMRIR